MNLRPDEITGIIKEQIKNYSSKLELKDIGTMKTPRTFKKSVALQLGRYSIFISIM